MDKQDNSRETAIDNAIKYGLIAVGIVAAIGCAVGLTRTSVKGTFEPVPHAIGIARW
jgi:hypothetical protein